jgi:hypothetical protein
MWLGAAFSCIIIEVYVAHTTQLRGQTSFDSDADANALSSRPHSRTDV